MVIIVWLLFALLPFVLGTGIQCTIVLMSKDKSKRKCYFSDGWLMGILVCILIGELSHVVAMAYLQDLVQCQKLFWMLLGVFCTGSFCAILPAWNHRRIYHDLRVSGKDQSPGVGIAFLVLLFVAVGYLFCVEAISVPGDIMTETVNSFLSDDGIYRVNPANGQMYTRGISERIKMLSLPTDYAILCMTFGMDAKDMIRHVIPVVVLMASLMAYKRLSRSLLGERGKWNYLFLIFVLLVFFFGDGAVYLPGYQVLHSGYLGESIRDLVLIPLTFSLMLDLSKQRNLFHILMVGACFMAEASICVTLWGMGSCLLVAAVMLMVNVMLSFRRKAGRNSMSWEEEK